VGLPRAPPGGFRLLGGLIRWVVIRRRRSAAGSVASFTHIDRSRRCRRPVSRSTPPVTLPGESSNTQRNLEEQEMCVHAHLHCKPPLMFANQSDVLADTQRPRPRNSKTLCSILLPPAPSPPPLLHYVPTPYSPQNQPSPPIHTFPPCLSLVCSVQTEKLFTSIQVSPQHKETEKGPKRTVCREGAHGVVTPQRRESGWRGVGNPRRAAQHTH